MLEINVIKIIREKSLLVRSMKHGLEPLANVITPMASQSPCCLVQYTHRDPGQLGKGGKP